MNTHTTTKSANNRPQARETARNTTGGDTERNTTGGDTAGRQGERAEMGKPVEGRVESPRGSDRAKEQRGATGGGARAGKQRGSGLESHRAHNPQAAAR